MNEQEVQSLFSKAFSIANPAIQELVRSGEFEKFIDELGKRMQLSTQMTNSVGEEVFMATLNLTPRENLAFTLEDEVNLSPEISAAIASDVEKRVFSLDTPDSPEEKEVPEPTPVSTPKWVELTKPKEVVQTVVESKPQVPNTVQDDIIPYIEPLPPQIIPEPVIPVPQPEPVVEPKPIPKPIVEAPKLVVSEPVAPIAPQSIEMPEFSVPAQTPTPFSPIRTMRTMAQDVEALQKGEPVGPKEWKPAPVTTPEPTPVLQKAPELPKREVPVPPTTKTYEPPPPGAPVVGNYSVDPYREIPE